MTAQPVMLKNSLLCLFLPEPLLALAGGSGKEHVSRAVESSLRGVLENSDDEADSDDFHCRVVVDAEY